MMVKYGARRRKNTGGEIEENEISKGEERTPTGERKREETEIER